MRGGRHLHAPAKRRDDVGNPPIVGRDDHIRDRSRL